MVWTVSVALVSKPVDVDSTQLASIACAERVPSGIEVMVEGAHRYSTQPASHAWPERVTPGSEAMVEGA